MRDGQITLENGKYTKRDASIVVIFGTELVILVCDYSGNDIGKPISNRAYLIRKRRLSRSGHVSLGVTCKCLCKTGAKRETRAKTFLFCMVHSSGRGSTAITTVSRTIQLVNNRTVVVVVVVVPSFFLLPTPTLNQTQ